MGFEFTPINPTFMSIVCIGGFYTNRLQVGLNNNNKRRNNMAIPFAAGAMHLLRLGTGAILRSTKKLSPYTVKIAKGTKPHTITKGVRKGTVIQKKKTGFAISKPKKGEYGYGVKKKWVTKELRPWAESIVGKKGVLAKFGVKQKGRAKVLDRYAASHRHLRKHKKLYGAGLSGAVAWDILDRDD